MGKFKFLRKGGEIVRKQIIRFGAETFKFTDKISPFASINEQYGRLYCLLHAAITMSEKTWYQPPHYSAEPTQKQLDIEDKHLEVNEETKKDIKQIADEIYLALTGIQKGENDSAN